MFMAGIMRKIMWVDQYWSLLKRLSLTTYLNAKLIKERTEKQCGLENLRIEQTCICFSRNLLITQRPSGRRPDDVLRLDTHSKNVIFSGRRKLFGRHQARLRLDKELSIFISLFNAVRDFGIRSLVTVWCNDPIHRVSLCSSLFLWPLPLRELDLIDLLQEQRPVVVLVEDLNNNADSGRLGRNSMVSDRDLRRKNTKLQTKRCVGSKAWCWSEGSEYLM